MIVFNIPYSGNLVVKMPKGTRIEKAILLEKGRKVDIVETSRDEYNVCMPVKDPGEPFVIKLQIEENVDVEDKYWDALT